MSLNKVTLIGNLGKDPEIRSTQDGRELASFSIATTESWKDKKTGEKISKSEWHNVTAFGAVVGVIKNYIKKGSKLYIEGKLETNKYTDKNGVEKYTTKIILQKLLMLGSKNSTQETKQEQPKMSQQDSNAIDDFGNDYVPF